MSIYKDWESLNEIRGFFLSKIRFETLQEKYALLLLVRVTELCADCIFLLKSKRIRSVPMILRSAIESYVDLKCVLDNPSHIEQLNSSFNRRMSKMLKGLDPEKSKFFGSLATQNEKKIWKKFSISGNAKLYQELYAHLCRHCHGNLDALVAEHVVNGNITVGHETNDGWADIYPFQVVTLMSVSLYEVLSFFSYQKS